MLRGVVIVALGACGFQSSQPVAPPIDALAAPAIDAEVPPDAMPDAPPRIIPPLCAPDAALVACFRFEAGVTNESTKLLATTETNTVAVEEGRVGRALYFGNTSVVEIADSSELDLGALTIEAWVKLAELPMANKRAVIADVSGQYSLAINPDGSVTCVLAGAVTLSRGAPFVRIDEWTHLACAYGGQGARLYIDGRLSLEQSATGQLSKSGKSGMSVGADNAVAGPMRSHLVGAIDELRLMSVARSAVDICIAAGQDLCPITGAASR